MKKWAGCLLILGLAVTLLFRYSSIEKPLQKQSADDFFNSHPPSSTYNVEDYAKDISDDNVEEVMPPVKETNHSRFKGKPHFVNFDGLVDLYSSHNVSDSVAMLVWGEMRSLLSRSDALPNTAQGIKEASLAWKELLLSITEEDKSLDEKEGQNLTKSPIIIQNAWTNASGWGKEERCPDRGSSDTPGVDGLAMCNAKIIRSNLQHISNASHLESLNRADGSNGTAHARPDFPFVQGYPFTATLWAGLEGFHMTVNGRHETSFSYREKLEPWSVNKVCVGGGLDIISALAKGLPVSQDPDLADVEQLKAPLLSGKKRLTMLIGVFSMGNNFERRMALRRTWMQYEAVRSGQVAVRFFIGLHTSKQVNLEIWKEAQTYKDIQLMPFVDYYTLLNLKTVAICILGVKFLQANYIMKTDDDAFVRIDEILSSLKDKHSTSLLYGRVAFESSPHRDKENKWYISTEEWPHSSYPPWAHGPGYIISRDIAKFIVQGHKKRDFMLFKLEDVAVGIWIEEFKQKGHKVQYVHDDRFYNDGCESNYILAHYQNPRMVLCLWEKLQKENQPNCCQ
ncbi:unnamed protein product [Cuscuta epithymum]|uniref:Galectin domain-containing protein n=1 Tax=Cuscuta epithymum TaxID=186058 RepID=A0AAV0F235_9ASTE|nr:unnamed protein product [Cuscuta epithymum]